MIEFQEVTPLLCVGTALPSTGYRLSLEVRPMLPWKAKAGLPTTWVVDYPGRIVPIQLAVSRHRSRELAVRSMIRRLQKFDAQYSEQKIAARKARAARSRPRLDEAAGIQSQKEAA